VRNGAPGLSVWNVVKDADRITEILAAVGERDVVDPAFVKRYVRHIP
jgi:hypothetical protein